MHRLALPGAPDHAHPSFTDLLKQAVWSDLWREDLKPVPSSLVKEIACLNLTLQKLFNLNPQHAVGAAGGLHKLLPVSWFENERFIHDLHDAMGALVAHATGESLFFIR
jgi:hypothetical protein